MMFLSEQLAGMRRMQHVNMENAGREVSQMPLVCNGEGEPDHLRQTLSLGVADASTLCRQTTATPGLADGTD